MQLQVVVHCLLNPHTRVKGLGPLDFKPEPPLIQLPCPEALYLGLDRWAVTRNQLDVPEFRRFCKSLIVQYADMIELLASKGASIGIVGAAGSPSCGVLTTSVGYQGGRVREASDEHVPGMGVFMEELTGELKRRGVSFNCQESRDESGNISAAI
jgi:predicted secreted protein